MQLPDFVIFIVVIYKVSAAYWHLLWTISSLTFCSLLLWSILLVKCRVLNILDATFRGMFLNVVFNKMCSKYWHLLWTVSSLKFLFVIVLVNFILSMKVKFYCVMSFIVSKIKEFAELCYWYRLFVWSWNWRRRKWLLWLESLKNWHLEARLKKRWLILRKPNMRWTRSWRNRWV